jgi:hypothetical protein
MKNILFKIVDTDVSLQDLQNDVNASIEKGYNHNFAFTRHTVQGLIDKVNELSENKMKLVFSEQHSWQGEKAVQQILAFTTLQMKKMFEEEMERRFKEAIANYASVDPDYAVHVRNKLLDSNAGAIYKLRSVLTGEGDYEACVRCGFTGVMVHESAERYVTPELALEAAMRLL